MEVSALPRVPLLLLFNDADAEFPAGSAVLFRKGADTYLDAEFPPAAGEEEIIDLLEIEQILTSVDGIDFVYLSESDVVRHRLVKEIIRAYANHDNDTRQGG